MVLGQMIDDNQDRMLDRHDCFLVPPVAHHPAIRSHQAAVFHTNGSQRGFRQRGAQPAVPFPRRIAGVFARTLVLAGQMIIRFCVVHR